MQTTILKAFDKATRRTSPSWEKMMALFRAISADDLLAVQKFVDRYGITQTAEHIEQRTALMTAASGGKIDILRYLLAAGSPVDARMDSGRTAFTCAIDGNHVECAQILMEAGAEIDPRGQVRDWRLLHSTVGFKCYDSFLFLLAQGVEIDCKNEDGVTPLIHAVRCCSGKKQNLEEGLPYVEKLLAVGAQMDQRDNEGRSAFEDARAYGLTDIVTLMQKHRRESLHKGIQKPIALLKPLRFRQRTAV